MSMNANMSQNLIKALFMAALMVATSVGATTIYDNLGNPASGTGSVFNSGPLYDSFTTPGAADTLNGLELALSGSGAAGTLTVGLYSAPGALIATLGTIDETTISSGVHDYVLALSSNPLLAANTRYWIGLSDLGGASWAWSAGGGVGVAGEFFASRYGTFPNAYGPFMMKVDYDPRGLPDAGSTASLLGIAVAALAGLRRKLV